MKIGHVQLDNPVVLAPMAGISDRVFRELVKEQGCGLVCSEMISAKGLVYGSRHTEMMLAVSEKEHPVSMQIFGREPEIMAEAVRILVNKCSADIIDINMGCPVLKVVKKQEGSALMLDPDHAGRVTEAVVKATELPVTVKIRKGWDDDNITAVQVAQAAAQAGAQAVMVHGRTKEQMYEGKADWDIIRQVKEVISVPVIGNGDIWEPEDARRMLDETGCDGVGVGRGVRGNPWLVGRIVHYLETGEIVPEPVPEERIRMAMHHLDKLVAFKGEYTAVREMRPHASWYIKGLPHATVMRREIMKASTKEEMNGILEHYLEELNNLAFS